MRRPDARTVRSRPLTAGLPTSSWWLGLVGLTFSRRAREEAARMRWSKFGMQPHRGLSNGPLEPPYRHTGRLRGDE